MEFKLEDFTLVIERATRREYKFVLLDQARKPVLIEKLRPKFWLNWHGTKLVGKVSQKTGYSTERVSDGLQKISGKIEMKGGKCLEPPEGEGIAALPPDQVAAVGELLNIVKRVKIVRQLDSESTYPAILGVEWDNGEKELRLNDKSIFSLDAVRSQFLRTFLKIPPALFTITAETWGKYVINRLGEDQKIEIMEQEESTEEYVCQLVTQEICRSRPTENPKEAVIPGTFLWSERRIWVPNTRIREILRTENMNTNLRKVREWVSNIDAGESKKIRVGRELMRFWPFAPEKVGIRAEEIEKEIKEGV